jgi:hypothetical protein
MASLEVTTYTASHVSTFPGIALRQAMRQRMNRRCDCCKRVVSWLDKTMAGTSTKCAACSERKSLRQLPCCATVN